MKKLFYISIACLGLIACTSQPTAEIKGTLAEAASEMLYIDHLGVNKTTIVDSLKVNKTGAFDITIPLTEYPDLYRLRFGKQQIVLALDSATQITITDSLIEGSENTAQIAEIRRSFTEKPLEEHKIYLRDIIIRNPSSLAAYYGLLQQKDGQFIFNPYDKQDRVCYAAVATAWNVYYPHTKRAKSIYNLVNGIIQEERRVLQNEKMQQLIAESESAFLDIILSDEYGINQALSAYRGEVILLDFSAVEMQQGQAYIFELRELYNKYHERGLEIYQVSADTNPIAWEQTAINLPWTTVRSEYGAYATAFQQYNVQTIPTRFLFNKKGEIIARDLSFDELPSAIEACLQGKK